jgi:hypothetical protein
VDVHPNTAECLLQCSGGWKAGDRITSTNNGSGVTNPKTGAPPHIGAIALTAANDGESGLVQVCIYDTVRGAVT